jgi:hypothetical protein
MSTKKNAEEKKLISVDAEAEGIAGEEMYLSQNGDPLTPAQFVEQFSTAVFINLLVMLGADINPQDVESCYGCDGVRLSTSTPSWGAVVMFVPALKPITAPLQKAIHRCVKRLFHDWSNHHQDPVALEAAKQRNHYDCMLAQILDSKFNTLREWRQR